MILTGKQNFQRGSNKNKAGKLLNSAGKRVFLAGHPSTLAGRCFSGVVTGGCFTMLPILKIQIKSVLETVSKNTNVSI